jgi:MYXO-CTERM domain-containing protein
MSLVRSTIVGGVLVAGVVLWKPTPAHACGGCFHEAQSPTENASVVTDHRMALSVSTTQTVLWDQVRYQGDPKLFAWVLPVHDGAHVELARDEWLATLEALTAPVIASPPVNCGYGYGGGGGGCGFGAGSSVSYDGTSYGGGADAGFAGNGNVQVVGQEVVGPYVAVTIRSADGQAIDQWLLDNGFAIPPNIEPVLGYYVAGNFDFLALKLAPNAGVQAMQPVRVVTPGADPTLPLRMVAAGIGDSVGLTLYIVSEGRYEPTSFPSYTIDRSKVLWDPALARSNYTQLFADEMQKAPGWVVEFSGAVSNLQSTYTNICMNAPKIPVPCDPGTGDAGLGDAQVDDAQATSTDGASQSDAASVDDAQSDAQPDDAAPADDAQADADTDAQQQDDAGDAGSTPTSDAGATCWVSACSQFTDFDVATSGMAPYDVRVTRIRTTLPAAALSVDLALGASLDQSTLSNQIQSQGYTNPSYDPCPSNSGNTGYKEGCGCETAGENRFALTGTALGVLALASIARKRRRRR